MSFIEDRAALRRHVMTATAGYLVCLTAAIILLGPIGLAASLIFLPFATALAFRSMPAPIETTSPDQRRAFILGRLSRFLGDATHPTVALVLEIDDHQKLEEIYGRAALDDAMTSTQAAIEECLTEADITIELDSGRFVTALPPQAAHDVEAMLNTCTRIQHAIIQISRNSDAPVQLTASIGFAASNKLTRPTAEGLTDAAFSALSEAKRNGPGAVRAYSMAISRKRSKQHQFAREASDGLSRGEIFAYFQPQLDLRTERLAGFEALTRWHHPERGIIAPDEFLPALEQAGLMSALNDVMMRNAIRALKFWDKSGLSVPTVGVNFSTMELRDPRLVERIAMQLDAADLSPARLNVEVLETVIANQSRDDVTGNLAALADLGCSIDLDDFGTGYASITNIRRFSVGRIKIDRSFVSGIDRDTEQQGMVSAMLTMSERLGVSAIAEGVETLAERETLARLGCQDIQGFQVARPMPVEETVDWAKAYFAKDADPIPIARRAS